MGLSLPPVEWTVTGAQWGCIAGVYMSAQTVLLDINMLKIENLAKSSPNPLCRSCRERAIFGAALDLCDSLLSLRLLFMASNSIYARHSLASNACVFAGKSNFNLLF